ncbi:hypothetical protein ABH940_006844 [Streptacidiphilus sp. BW17]
MRGWLRDIHGAHESSRAGAASLRFAGDDTVPAAAGTQDRRPPVADEDQIRIDDHDIVVR